jgi:hypothetical protein
VESNETATLKIGGPLKNTVEIRRVGRVLQLAYKLTGIDGKVYVPTVRDLKNPPKFAVFRGDKEIGSGTFAYG